MARVKSMFSDDSTRCFVSRLVAYDARTVRSNNDVPIPQTLNSQSSLLEHLHSNNPQSISLAVPHRRWLVHALNPD